MSTQRQETNARNEAMDHSTTVVESQKLTSTKIIYDHQHVGGLFGVKTLQSTEDMTATDLPTQYEGFPIDPNYLKGLILNQSNKAKIRSVLLSLGGIPKSGKSKAISHLLKHYVDANFFNPMTKKSERSEGITYYELIVTSYHSKRNLTITEVTKESSCAFGILSALRNELLANGKMPLLDIPERPSQYFADLELDNLLCHMFQYLHDYEHTPRGNEVTDDGQEYARHLNKLLPESIGLIHIWDIASNKAVHHFLNSLHGLIYNSHVWLFLDIERDLIDLEKPLNFLDETRIGTSSSGSSRPDQSVLMKRSPRLCYLFRSSRMSESKHGPRIGTCTIFAKHEGAYNKDLKQRVKILEGKVKQAAKHYGVSSLIEPKIETIDFNVSDVSDDSSLHLYQKFLQLIYQTPYENVPLSWVFLRSLFYHSKKKFIAKSELRKKANECGIDDNSFTKFCKFYASFGSIFDLSLIDPDYPYVIVKPMGFLKSLDKFLCPDDITCQQYPTLMNGMIPENACKEAFGENWSAYMEALVSVNLAAKIPSSQLVVPNSNPDDTYYFIPLSRKGSLIMEPDPSAVHLITSVNTPDIFTQAILIKYLLRLLPEPKLVPCSNVNQTIIKECSTGTIITLVSHSPATKISVDQPSPRVCSLIIKAYDEIAEMCKIGIPKYKFVIICAKSIVPTVRDIPSCQYHVLPNDTLCDECMIAERANRQLLSWNIALRKYPIPRKCILNEELKSSEPTQIAEKISSYTLEVIPYLAEALQLDPSQSSSVSAMISSWNEKLVKSSLANTIEPRRILARKLVEVCAKLCSLLDYGRKVEAESTFETLAKELDVHAPSIKQLQAMAPHLTEQDNEITRDIYEKYSQEDGVIPFKAVKWILIGPPQVGKLPLKCVFLMKFIT